MLYVLQKKERKCLAEYKELGGSKHGAALNAMARTGLLEKVWHAQRLKVGEGVIRQTSGRGRAFQEGDTARARA